jgi:hypothetical protein
MIQEVNAFFKANNLDIPEIDRTKFLSSEEYQKLIPKLEGNILISEMANADVVNYSKEIIIKGQILPNEKWISIIEGVLFGIRDMQKKNIIHKDLHPGNVLVLIKNEGEVIIPLIHDFGSSEILESWSGEDTRSFDIFTFLSKLIIYELDIEKPGTSEPAKITDSMTPEFLDFIKRFLSIIEEQSKDPSHETPEFMDEYELIILDNLGKVVYSKNCSGWQETVGFENFNEGIYFIRLMSEGNLLYQTKLSKIGNNT